MHAILHGIWPTGLDLRSLLLVVDVVAELELVGIRELVDVLLGTHGGDVEGCRVVTWMGSRGPGGCVGREESLRVYVGSRGQPMMGNAAAALRSTILLPAVEVMYDYVRVYITIYLKPQTTPPLFYTIACTLINAPSLSLARHESLWTIE